MADYITISAFLDLASLEALLLKCVAKNYKKVKLCTRTKIKHGFVKSLFPSVTVKWPIRNYLFGETVLCSLPSLNNYTLNDQSLSDKLKWTKIAKFE